MLAYSVFSLRLSEDVPSQSDSVHLISLYLTFCMFFSLSAMTWFAVTNKLRETKRLPRWLRWLAIDYLCWIVCATSMHRKAVRTAKQQLKTPLVPSSTPLTIQLQPLIPTNSLDNPNSLSYHRISLPTSTIENISLHPSTPDMQLSHGSKKNSTVWVRRTVSNAESTTTTTNGPENRKSKQSSQKPRQSNKHSPSKNQESLYAVHIINRLVFLMFLILVIVINIYTWFFYSRTVPTKLLDNQTSWTCFDESRLEVIDCNEAF